ncbi:c-type cytochrome [Sphingomonas panacisoli]|nr:c-type cytochrome [Sphingomonas panacisoli]
MLMLTACAPAGRDDTRVLIASQCAACHIVTGVPTARGRVGPSLVGIGRRRYIAGTLPNTPANLRRFLEHPQSVQPRGAMPELGLTPQQANAIAAYLETAGGS